MISLRENDFQRPAKGGSTPAFACQHAANIICFANVGCSPTPRQHFCKTAAPKNFLVACGSFFATIIEIFFYKNVYRKIVLFCTKIEVLFL